MKIKIVMVLCAIVAVGAVIGALGQRSQKANVSNSLFASDEIFAGEKIVKTDVQWKKILTPEAFYVLRKKGTERAFTGALTDNKKHGIYVCGACGLHLFSSENKFD